MRATDSHQENSTTGEKSFFRFSFILSVFYFYLFLPVTQFLEKQKKSHAAVTLFISMESKWGWIQTKAMIQLQINTGGDDYQGLVQARNNRWSL